MDGQGCDPKYTSSLISPKRLELTLGSNGPPLGNGIWRIVGHVTLKCEGRDIA